MYPSMIASQGRLTLFNFEKKYQNKIEKRTHTIKQIERKKEKRMEYSHICWRETETTKKKKKNGTA